MRRWLRPFRPRPAGKEPEQVQRGGKPGADDAIDSDSGEVLAVGGTPDDEQPTVRGERSIPSVNRERSVRSRVSGALAAVTMALLGGGFLIWYYATQANAASRAQTAAQRADEERISGEMKLPPLGRVDPPQQHAPEPRGQPAAARYSPTDDPLGSLPALPVGLQAEPVTAAAPSGTPPKNPAQLALERRLGQPVLLRGPNPSDRQSPTMDPALAAALGTAPMMRVGDAPATTPTSGNPLGSLLRPTATPAVVAQVLPTQRFLLAKGAFIDCTLETAIDSTYDGMVTCIGATDTYSADGKVVLLERGTKYVGEKRGEVRQGQGRVFVLWTEARTPTGVVVPLASPGTDELGRSGLPGFVDTHFWDRFGAAVLISVIDGTLQALSAQRSDGTSVMINPQMGREVLTEVLKGTIAIAPTVVKNQGDRIQVLVARDVDFRGVYALRNSNPSP